jgi:FMN phosphatase YigB (HAD superfamily)
MVEAITFDFWNTVMWEEPGSLRQHRIEYWHEGFRRAGVPVDGDALARAHDLAHARYESSWRAGTQFRAEDATALMAAELGTMESDTARAILLEGFDEGGRRAAVHPCDGVRDCLAALRSGSIRVGIICDIGLTPSPVVREVLTRHELLSLFDDTAFSDEVGVYKPAPAIFAHALAALGNTEFSHAAHVGDRRRTDVAGALAVGMTAVRYRGVYDDLAPDAPEADLVLDDLVQLPAALGLSPTFA